MSATWNRHLAQGQLREPIEVTVDVGPGRQYVAVHHETGIYGAGDSEHAALMDLRAALAEYRDILVAEPKLSTDLAQCLLVLNRILIPAQVPA